MTLADIVLIACALTLAIYATRNWAATGRALDQRIAALLDPSTDADLTLWESELSDAERPGATT